MPTPDKDKLRAQLEKTGEAAVRANLAQGVYGSWKRDFIEQWLREKEEAREVVLEDDRRSSEGQKLIWTKIGVVAAVVGAIATIAGLWFAP